MNGTTRKKHDIGFACRGEGVGQLGEPSGNGVLVEDRVELDVVGEAFLSFGFDSFVYYSRVGSLRRAREREEAGEGCGAAN